MLLMTYRPVITRITLWLMLQFCFFTLLTGQNTTSPSDPSTWTVDPSQYSASMFVVAQLSWNGTISQNQNDQLAVFVGTQCRGVATLDLVESFGQVYASIAIYTNSPNDSFRFYIYNASVGEVLPAKEEISYRSNTLLGSFEAPFIFSNQILSWAFEVEKPLCQEDSTGTLRAINFTGLQPPFLYQWSTGDTTSKLTGLTPAQYTLSVTDVYGFRSADSLLLSPIYESIPGPNIVASSSVVCPGESFELLAGSTDALRWNYTWLNRQGDTLAMAKLLFIDSLNQSDTFSVSQHLRSCRSAFSEIRVGLSRPNADFEFTPGESIRVGDTVFFDVINFVDANRYFWDFGDGTFSAQPSPAHIYQSEGEYFVSLRVTDSLGCTNRSVITEPLVVSLATSSQNNNLPGQMIIYPNPVDDYLRIEARGLKGSFKTLQLIDVNGNKRWEYSSDNKNGIPEMVTVPMYDQAEGIYFLCLIDWNRNILFSKKILKK